MVAGLLSGVPDIVLPVVAAAELVFLAGLGTNKRFQKVVDASEKEEEDAEADAQAAKLRKILAGLSPGDRKRYESLRQLCVKLRQLARGFKEGEAPDAFGITEMQVEGVNRLLWIYLKLLYSKNALETFFKTIDLTEIEADVQRTRQRLDELGPAEPDDDFNEERRRKLLVDTLLSSEQRVENYRKAMENHDFVSLELERLYSKIAGLAEMGINRQDADHLSTEIDVVSASMEQTERAMNELDFLTGFSREDDAPPPLLETGKP